MALWTNNETLNSIRIRADLLDSDTRFNDANLLLLLNEEFGSWLVPLIAEMLGEYFVTTQDTLLAASSRRIDIPGQAVGGRVRLVQLLDPNQNPRFNCRQVDAMDDVRWGAATSLGNFGDFFFRGDQLILLGPIQVGCYLRIAYERRPSECVLTSSCALITNISGNVVTVSSFPSGMVTATLVDFVRGASPWTTLQSGTALPAPSGLTVTFTSLPTGLAIGDYLCFQGQAPFVQAPREAIPVLRQWLAIQALVIKGDEKSEASAQLLTQTDRRMRKILAPRSIGNRKPVGNGLATPVGGWPGVWGL